MTFTPVVGVTRSQTGWRAGFQRAQMLGVSALFAVRQASSEPPLAGARPACLQRLHMVDVLLALPLHQSVRECALTARQRRILADAASDIVDRSSYGSVTRRVAVPLHVDHAMVPARSFRRGLESASSFSMYCTRSMALPRTVEVSAVERAEASYFGVGVYRADGAGSIQLLVAPELFPQLPDTAASWVFCEQLHAQLETSAQLR